MLALTQCWDNSQDSNMLSSFTGTFKFGRRRYLPLLPAGYVTLAGLTWAPMTTGGTYAQAQTHAANFSGLGLPLGAWRTATVAELQSLTAVLSYADAQSVHGWAFSSHAYNIWTSESGRVVNFNTGANVGTSNTNNFNFLNVKKTAVPTQLSINLTDYYIIICEMGGGNPSTFQITRDGVVFTVSIDGGEDPLRPLGHTITVDSISGAGPYSVAQVLGTVTGAELGGVCTSQQFTVTVTAVA